MIVQPKFKVGEYVWAAFIQTNGSVRYARMFGPVPICGTSIQATEKQGNFDVEPHYKINALDATYRESNLYATGEEALQAMQNLLAPEQKAAA